jgi:hypothetical protein
MTQPHDDDPSYVPFEIRKSKRIHKPNPRGVHYKVARKLYGGSRVPRF